MTDTTPDTGPRHWLGMVHDGDFQSFAPVHLWGPDVDGGYLLVDNTAGESLWLPPEAVSDLVPAVVQPEATPDTRDADLAQAAAGLLDLSKRVLAVKPTLDQPYLEEPAWTPWTRFVERPCRTAYNLGCRLRGELRARGIEVPRSAQTQAEATPDTADEVERLAEIAYETQRQAWLPTLRINRWAEQSDSLRESWRKGIRAVLAARRSAGEA